MGGQGNGKKQHQGLSAVDTATALFLREHDSGGEKASN